MHIQGTIFSYIQAQSKMGSNSKNYRRIENHTHVNKMVTPQNFFLAFTDELGKQLIFIKKTVEMGQ